MEGAAVAHVCQLNSRPFLVVRTISDDASEGAEEQFSLALEMAPINTFAMIRRFIGAAQPEPVG